MANISEITIEVPFSGLISEKMKNSLKKAAATGTKIIQTTGQYMGEKPTGKEQTQKFITNEPPTTPEKIIVNETPTTENKKGFPWWIVAAAGVGLILLNSNNKKRKK